MTTISVITNYWLETKKRSSLFKIILTQNDSFVTNKEVKMHWQHIHNHALHTRTSSTKFQTNIVMVTLVMCINFYALFMNIYHCKLLLKTCKKIFFTI